MGGGSYRYESASVRSLAYKTSYAADSSYLDNDVFKQRSLNPQMNIKGKIRESCASAEHPEPITVYVGLDVTGSMGHIPKYLITEGFPTLMKKIIDAGIEHVQVCFIGIGDNESSDRSPIQVGQFETDDELQEKWLKLIHLEGGGGAWGPEYGEGYALAWYLAARHTKLDSYDKQRRKGILITIGDEQFHDEISKDDLDDLFGEAQSGVKSIDIYNEACQKWNVYHINVMDRSGRNEWVKSKWSQLLKDNLINTQTEDGVDVPDIIASIVIDEVKKFNDKKQLLTEGQGEPVMAETIEPTVSENTKSEIIL